MIVKHCGKEIVRRRDGVKITGKMQVDLIHGDHLRIAAACSTTFHAEHGTKARLSDADDHLFPEAPKRLTHAYRHRALALTCRRRVDAGDENETAGRFPASYGFCTDLCLMSAVRKDFLRGQSDFAGHFSDRAEFRGL